MNFKKNLSFTPREQHRIANVGPSPYIFKKRAMNHDIRARFLKTYGDDFSLLTSDENTTII
jgi:hypothetical protein